VTCDDGSPVGAIDLAPGETVTCTFTNTIQRGEIVVVKQTDPAGSLEDFGFTTNYGSPFSLVDDGFSLSGPLLPTSENGTYSVAEDAEAGWELTSATCDDGSPVNAIDLGPGETVTCTFVNTILRGEIVVVKQTDPDGSAESFDFTTNYGSPFSLVDDGFSLSGPLLPTSENGTYSVSETVPFGWELTSATCDDGSPVSAIDLGPGETVTCTFNNTLLLGSITVVKIVQGGPDEEFCFDTEGDGFPEGDDFFCIETSGGSGEFFQDDLFPGAYGVSEQQTGQYILATSFCDNGDDPGSITLGPDEDVTCTFINVLPLSVPVNNVWALLLLTLMLLATGWYFRPASVRRS